MVKHRQLAPTMGLVSDDLPTNFMASPNRNDALDQGTTFTFGSWTCVVDGSGGFTNHLDGCEVVESISTNQHLLNNSATSAAGAENPPEDPQGEENFDLIKRFRSRPNAPTSFQDYNPDPFAAVDQFLEKVAKCINLAQATLEHCGTPYVMSPTAYHQPEHVIGYLD